jgi:hypothetical protein
MKLVHTASLIAVALLFSLSASAQATRTWVSGVGDDANPCSRTAPCKTFAGAYSKTAIGGEIDALDSGGFGTLTISKSITIDGGSNIAGVLATGVNGFIINTASTDVVTLRSLDINGSATGLNGVNVIGGGTVRVEKSRIYNFSQGGVSAVPTTGTLLNLIVTDSVISACVGNVTAVNVDGTTVPVNATLDNVQIHRCGLALTGTNGKITARNFDFSSNTNGVVGWSNAVITLDSGLISYNTDAVQSSGNSVIRLTNMTILDNVNGLLTAGGTIVSFNNNRIKGNVADGNPTTTYFLR